MKMYEIHENDKEVFNVGLEALKNGFQDGLRSVRINTPNLKREEWPEEALKRFKEHMYRAGWEKGKLTY